MLHAMKNLPNVTQFHSIIGFILLLFSISYMPIRIESLLVKRLDLIEEKEIEEAAAEVLSMEHSLSQEQMNDLNNDVTQTNNEITRLINHSAAVNDSINALMSRAPNEPHLLDTIQQLYNYSIIADERKIDSLNQLFTEKSTRLMEHIRSFNQKDRDLKIAHSTIRNRDDKIHCLSVLLSIHVGILVVTLLSGLYFFIIGLNKWSWQGIPGQDSGVE